MTGNTRNQRDEKSLVALHIAASLQVTTPRKLSRAYSPTRHPPLTAQRARRSALGQRAADRRPSVRARARRARNAARARSSGSGSLLSKKAMLAIRR
jgi:hypothetical protein